MKGNYMKWLAAVAVPLIAFMIGCGDPIPVKEMSTARHEISRAEQVKADKYAKELFEAAGALLIKSHDAVKNGKFDDAKKDADAATAKAKEAYDAAIPLLAKDAIDTADQSVAAAEGTYSSELANADYENAVTSQKKAHDLFGENKYMESYKAAIEADNYAKNARSLSLSKKSYLKDAIDEVNETIARAEKLGAEKSAPEKLKLARANVDIASKSYDDLKLKEGFSAIQVAKMNADDAYIDALKVTAEESIAKAESMIAEAEKSKGSDAAADEIEGAKEMLKTAKTQLEEDQYPESIQSSEEAQRFAAIAMETITQNAARTASSGKGKGGVVAVSGDVDSGEYDLYIVKYYQGAKDCLWFIAYKFYKNAKEWPKIYKANRDIIKNPNFIKPGWKLKVPRKAGQSSPAAQKVEQPAIPAQKDDEVVVAPVEDEESSEVAPVDGDGEQQGEAVEEESAPSSDEQPVEEPVDTGE
jgi:nucleoid-associated protein YgaU